MSNVEALIHSFNLKARVIQHSQQPWIIGSLDHLDHSFLRLFAAWRNLRMTGILHEALTDAASDSGLL